MSNQPLGEARVRRWIDQEHCVLLARGDFSALFDAYVDHSRRWNRAPDPLTSVMMRQGLAAAALYLSCRPRDENVGWTVSFREPLHDLFFTGDAGANSVTGRFFDEGLQGTGKNRLYVQSNRGGSAASQSHIEISSMDLLDIFEEYYSNSEQHPARFFDYDDGSFAMVLGLPDCDQEWIGSLDRDLALDHIDQQDGSIDSRQFVFACGCSPNRMMEVVRCLYEEDPLEFFDGEDEVEVQCPRCGRLWNVAQADL